MKKNHDLIGEIVYEVTWDKEIEYMLYGKEYTIPVHFEGEYEDELSDEQVETYNKLMKALSDINLQIENKIYDFYQDVIDECREMLEDLADEFAPIIKGKHELVNLVTPISMVIDRENDGITKIFFNTKWDLESGIGVKVKDNKIIYFGTQQEIV